MKTPMTVEDLDPKGKRVFVRVDFNVPLDEKGTLADDTRIREALPTIRFLLDRGGRVVLASHLGRPKGKPDPKYSLKPVARHLSTLLNKKVEQLPDCVGSEVERKIAELKEGEAVLLENLRFHEGEEKNDPAFVGQLAKLADLYVNDAFGTAHRAHASTEGLPRRLGKAAAGFLMLKEIRYLGQIVENPARPFVAILGGAKISGKIDVIQNLMKKVDALVIGGGMAYTFARAQGYPTGKSLVEEDRIATAKAVLEESKRKNIKLVLPADNLVADRFDASAKTQVVSWGAIPEDWEGVDVGPQTLKRYAEILKDARTIFWNGPVGVFEIEPFSKGTLEVAKLVAAATERGAVTVVGGGDSVAAVQKMGLSQKMSHISTGGGASLEFVEGKTLPGLAVLTPKN